MSTKALPLELHDQDNFWVPVALLKEHYTRGVARAFFASEWDVPFTRVRIRTAYYRFDVELEAEMAELGEREPYDGWPLIECGPGEPGEAYWLFEKEASGVE